ncbi:hypothetical protein [Vibrio nomapromontoriensis]|uniref:hypothetical protein n=1 Tax=Vibrio nomapromontoriensis TaxID=2910246 RepID=UPI003D107FDD
MKSFFLAAMLIVAPMLITAPRLIAAPSYADSLCQSNEVDVTGCELRNGKTVSFCADSEGLVTYRYGKVAKVELSVTEPSIGAMKISSESYSRGAASEYQAVNGQYYYDFVDALYGSNDANYLLLELDHRGVNIPWLNEGSMSHHTINKSLTVSHETKGELVSLLCVEDSHFYGEPHKQADYIHIMREVSEKYRHHLPDSIPQCQDESDSCIAIYEDSKQEFVLVYFLPIENSAFINNRAYLIKAVTGAISEVSLSLLTEVKKDEAQPILSLPKTLHLTLDRQQTVVSIEARND